MGDLTELEQALIAFSAAKKPPSTARKIREISNTIEHVIADGLSLDLVVSFLNQNGINISKNTLKVTLYRLRKREKKPQKTLINNSPAENITTSVSPQPSVVNKNAVTLAELTKKMDAFNKAVGWQDRFVALGGSIEDIRGKPASEQRQMAMHLKSTIERELRDHQ
ncbi:MAG: hypothetical protein ACRC4K_10130 [Plesiomonas shigelloides]